MPAPQSQPRGDARKRRTALGLSTFFAVVAAATATIAQLRDRQLGRLPRIVFRCAFFAPSTEAIQDIDSAAVASAPCLALARHPGAQSIATISVGSGWGLSD